MKNFISPIASICLLTGCAHKYVEKVALSDRSDPKLASVVSAPRDGMYHVQLLAGGKYIKTRLYAADRWVRKGEQIGFRAGDHGTVLAIAADQEVSLTELQPARRI